MPSSGGGQRIDTVLIRRLASEVAADADVVAAWEEAEALRQQLRLKDAELQTALEALAAAQAFGESPRSVQRHQETAGQQLARFLKDQLSMRDGQLVAAQEEAAELGRQLQQRERQLAASEEQLGAAQTALLETHHEAEALRRQQAGMQQELEVARGGLAPEMLALHAAHGIFQPFFAPLLQQLLLLLTALSAPKLRGAAEAAEQAEAANYARLEVEEARRDAAAQLQQLRSELCAVEARANLTAYGTPGGGLWFECLCRRVPTCCL